MEMEKVKKDNIAKTKNLIEEKNQMEIGIKNRDKEIKKLEDSMNKTQKKRKRR